jgi:hypothetical protein
MAEQKKPLSFSGKVHEPYHCDVHGGMLRDFDTAGCGNKYGTWTAVRDGAKLKRVRMASTVCLKCDANGDADKFLRKARLSLQALFNGRGRGG